MVALPSLAGADWLAAPEVQRIFKVLGVEGDEVRVVGGAVRNALLGLPVGDVDFATTATPQVVIARAEAAGMKAVPTGVEHGTVTLVSGGAGYEVTTLREDIETDGRRAVVRFGRDWEADARRRDFTINALSAAGDGTVHDPVDGYADIAAGRVRFIGEAEQRIAEDRLRILRFFRLHAQYGKGALDPAGLSVAIRARDGLRRLSAERIGQEMRRLVMAPRAAGIVATMQESGILGIILGGVGYLGPFARLGRFEDAAAIPPSVPIRLAALGCRVKEDVERLTGRLRLANAERDRMAAVVGAAGRFAALPEPRRARALLYRLGREGFHDAVALAVAWGADAADAAEWIDLYLLPERWRAPRFPLGGRDLVRAGAANGPAIGELLRAIEAWWVEHDFAADEAALRTRLQQMLAAAQ